MNFDHLKEQRIPYGTHLARVFKASAKLLWLAVAGFIHGLFPFVFVNTVTTGIKEVQRDLFRRPRPTGRPRKQTK
jgi:hypothetical protein